MTKPANSAPPKVRYDVCATLTTRNQVVPLKGAYAAPRGAKAGRADRLPLVVRQGQTVRFEDQYFHLTKEGLYQFSNWGKVRYDHPLGRPEIVDERKSCTAVILFRKDILSLFGSVAVLTVHGHTHDPASHEERLARMKLGGVALTCGSIARFMCRLLADLGWKTRMVQCRRTEGVFDTYNCGHLLFEFYWPKRRKWVLADVDAHQMFVQDDEYLNLAEVKDRIDRGKPISLEPLTPAGVGLIDTTEMVTSDFTGMALFQHTLLDTNHLKEWYRKMFAAVAMREEGVYYCPDPKGRKRIEMYCPGARFLCRKDWYETYYGNKG